MRIYVRVVPRASCNTIEKLRDNEYRVRLTAAPVDGKANETLITLLSKHFHTAKSCIAIVGGKTARTKIVDITL